jgi:ankyrin repeat protein
MRDRARLQPQGRSSPVRWRAAARLFKATKQGDLFGAQRLLVRHPRLVHARDSGGYTPLLWAAKRGHISLVRLLLAKGAQVNVRNNWRNTPLHWAAYNGHLAVVARLLKAGADPNAREREMGHTPLHDAAWKGRRRVIALLLKAGARPDLKNKRGQTPRQIAQRHGHWTVARLLEGRDRQPRTVSRNQPRTVSRHRVQDGSRGPARARPDVLALAKRGDLKGLRRVLARRPSLVNAAGRNGYTPLIRAARQGHLAVVKYLLRRGAKVNAVNRWRNTALHWAAYNGHERVVALLVRRRAKKNIQEIEKGNTPLHDAAWKGRRRVVALLLKAGARPDLQNGRGETPRQVAQRLGHLQVASLIRGYERGGPRPATSPGRAKGLAPASPGRTRRRRIMDLARQGDAARLRALLKASPRLVHARDKDGRTPLIWAARQGRLEAVKVLLAKGAKVDASSRRRLTALHWAAVGGHHQVAVILLRHRPALDVPAKDKGFTPLHEAARNGRYQVVKLLLQAGADLKAKTATGLTPFQVAVKAKQKAVAELIRRHGGR